MPFIDLTGQTFNRLTIKKRVENDKWGQACWQCQCICGNITIVTGGDLRSGNTKSCGCLDRELSAKRLFVHGMTTIPEYNTWMHMKERCYNPNNKSFKDYGQRGITICDEWRESFSNFYKHVGPKPFKTYSIERIDNNRGYFPDNVYWADMRTQANNRRSSRNITLHGHTMTLARWGRFTKIDSRIIWNRINKLNWSPAKAIFTPVRHK